MPKSWRSDNYSIDVYCRKCSKFGLIDSDEILLPGEITWTCPHCGQVVWRIVIGFYEEESEDER